MTKLLGLALASVFALAAQPAQPPDAVKELASLRAEIDEIDQDVVALLNRRANVVLKIGLVKRRIGKAVLDQGREDQVVKNLAEANHGPLSDAALAAIYSSIMAAMRDLQTPQ